MNIPIPKKIFQITVSLFFFLGIISPSAVFAEEVAPSGGVSQAFLVSAYYSPLPGQKGYVRGTYEADIRLNGRGVSGADGTAVYPGMLAAPSSYTFGTKVFIPGLGVGTVHDRGGAILELGNVHRIDVWMGYGDEGRIRALAWGMRNVDGRIYSKGLLSSETIAFQNFSIPVSQNTSSSQSLTLQTLSLGTVGDDVKKLQKILTDLGVYSGELSGTFNSETENALFSFQKTEGIVSQKSDSGAGVFGPKTKIALASAFSEYAATMQATEQILFPAGMGKGSEGAEVSRLQLFLADLGFFQGSISGTFGSVTEKAVLAFQLSNGVVLSEKEQGAGFVGPKTQTALTKTVISKIAKAAKTEVGAPVMAAIEKTKEPATVRSVAIIDTMEISGSASVSPKSVGREERIASLSAGLRK